MKVKTNKSSFLVRFLFHSPSFMGRIVQVGMLVGAVMVFMDFQAQRHNAISYTTALIERGDIIQTVSAIGSLNPMNTVSVGTQVSGAVVKLYAKNNDKVKKGQLLAEIDPALLVAQLKQSEAQLANSKESVELAELNAERLGRLYKQEYVARTDWENANQSAKTARTTYEISKAQLDRDKANLEYANVHSPVDGVVISREVTEGQTVQSSYQTPELFKIAEDMTQMQIELALSEGDVGAVKADQRVFFTVDAYRDRTFDGTLKQVLLKPNKQNGVVTYTATVGVKNDDNLLLPGMTANVNIVTGEKKDVLRAPNAALRFTPSGTMQQVQQVQQVETMEATNKTERQSTIYVLENGRPKPVPVKTGMVGQHYTEIITDALHDKSAVVVREQKPIIEDEEKDSHSFLP